VHAENRQTGKNYSSPQKKYKKKTTPEQKAEAEADEAVTAYFKTKMSRLDAIPTQGAQKMKGKRPSKCFY
jgi:hypothetical protein